MDRSDRDIYTVSGHITEHREVVKAMTLNQFDFDELRQQCEKAAMLGTEVALNPVLIVGLLDYMKSQQDEILELEQERARLSDEAEEAMSELADLREELGS
jgi:Tfp pilus assembly protein PilO